jgi:hypothetical protein
VSAPPVGLARLAEPPLARVAAGGFGRVALACCVLVLAAIVVTMSGGAGFGGALDALFGTHADTSRKAAPPVRAAAPALSVRRAAPRRHVNAVTPARPPANRRRAASPRRSAPVAERPAPAAPAPVPVPAPAPVQIPKPAPDTNRQLERTVETVKQVAVPLAPAAQPVTDQLTTTVGQVCGMLGGCP